MSHRTIAVIPVFSRTDLVRLLVGRLLQVNMVDEIVCVGSLEQDKRACIQAGAAWVDFNNHFLGAKWNAGFKFARDLKPDSVLYVGSSNWLSANWIETLRPKLDDVAMVGKCDAHYLDYSPGFNFRALYWSGYQKARKGEPIGMGRLIRADALDAIDWQPFTPYRHNGMDYMMLRKIIEAGFKIASIDNAEAVSVRVSSNQWNQKHTFDMVAKTDGAQLIDHEPLLEIMPDVRKFFKP